MTTPNEKPTPLTARVAAFQKAAKARAARDSAIVDAVTMLLEEAVSGQHDANRSAKAAEMLGVIHSPDLTPPAAPAK